MELIRLHGRGHLPVVDCKAEKKNIHQFFASKCFSKHYLLQKPCFRHTYRRTYHVSEESRPIQSTCENEVERLRRKYERQCLAYEEGTLSTNLFINPLSVIYKLQMLPILRALLSTELYWPAAEYHSYFSIFSVFLHDNLPLSSLSNQWQWKCRLEEEELKQEGTSYSGFYLNLKKWYTHKIWLSQHNTN